MFSNFTLQFSLQLILSARQQLLRWRRQRISSSWSFSSSGAQRLRSFRSKRAGCRASPTLSRWLRSSYLPSAPMPAASHAVRLGDPTVGLARLSPACTQSRVGVGHLPRDGRANSLLASRAAHFRIELAGGLARRPWPDRARHRPCSPACDVGRRPPASLVALPTSPHLPKRVHPVVALSPVRLAALASPHFRCGARSVSGRVLAALAISSDNSFSHLGSLSYVALL